MKKKLHNSLPSQNYVWVSKLLKVMKITLLLLILGLCNIYASVYSQSLKIDLNLKNVTLKEAFENIERQTNYKFLFRSDLINVDRTTDLESTGSTNINELLTKLLKDTKIGYDLVNNNLIVLSPEQSKKISGIVTDAATGESLPGVSVFVEGTTKGTVTGTDGKFTLDLPNAKAVLVFSFIGYETQKISTFGKSTIIVKLKTDVKKLDEVVVVGYGTQTKRFITGAVQSLGGDNLIELPVSTMAQKLQGKLSGVQINQTTGSPGQDLQVTIRGAASISTSSSPLYVVDGFPIMGGINNINPDEIESITVLKDAASTALYGSRAAFGVVVITTKSAKSGQTNINVSAYTGVQYVPQKGRPDMMNGTEYAQFRKESFGDAGLPVPEVFSNPAQYGKGYDWYDAMLRTAVISNYNLSINTNKEKFNSSIVASYLKQDGVMLNSGYDRFSFRANSSYQVLDNLKVGLNLAPSYTIYNSPPSDGWFNGGAGAGLLNEAMLTPPILPYQNADGTLPSSVTNPNVTAFPTPNWVKAAKEIKRRSNNNYILSNGYIEYKPIKSLVLKSTINVELYQSFYDFFQPSTSSARFAETPSALTATLNQNNSHYSSWLNENTATYSKQIGDHTFDILAGYTVQKFRNDVTSISGSDFPDDRIQTIDAALIKDNPTMDVQEWSLISYLSRINYNYKGKYLLGASIRSDGSSRFGANNKWGTFPAFSLGWIASEESFLKDYKWISLLKIRGTYGVTGNNNIGNYTQYATVANSNVVFGNTIYSGIAVTGMGNSDLGWETTKQFDFGIDLSVFNNRISITYDYYLKKTSNLLLALPLPQESGFSSQQSNVGKIKFWGNEFGISSKNLVGNFKWSTEFNISFSDNKVLALSSLTDHIYASSTNGTYSITKVGGRIGQLWGLVQNGVYVNQQDFDSSPKSVDSQVGTIKFKDLNHDGVIKTGDDDGDKTIIGNPYPKFTYGMTNDFSYKCFDLSIVISGSYGNDIARLYDSSTANLDGVFNVYKDVKNRWRSPENPGDGKYGKTTASTAEERSNFSTRFVHDGSYLTVKNITLGYNLPMKNNKYFSSVRLYSSVQQAFVFTKYPGNPEVGSTDVGGAPNSLTQGMDYSAYPVPRTITFGLNVNLK